LGGGLCALALGVVDTDTYAKEGVIFGAPLFRQYCVQYDFQNAMVKLFVPIADKPVTAE
jgi:hypothetical protein